MELNKDKRYLIAVSGGPDSMALLDMVRKEGIYLEVAHVNYHHRNSALRDEKIVHDYCAAYGIPFHRKDYVEGKGNFQAAARDFRYTFFSELCDQYDLSEVLLAHHKDDLLETYLMQKEKGIGVSYYGLKERNVIKGVKIYRPLLKYEKKDLLLYCMINDLDYGIDESNLGNDYRRNIIRHEQIEKMDAAQKDLLLKEIGKLNCDKEEQLKKAEGELKNKEYSVNGFLSTPFLKVYLHEHFPEKSDRHLDEMLRQLKESPSCLFKGSDLWIGKDYEKIRLYQPFSGYEYTYQDREELKKGHGEYFRICSHGSSLDAVWVKDSDFPLTIRNCHQGDKILLKYGHKGLNRFFIDRKIPKAERLSWPLLINCQGEVILVPGIGCDLNHYCEKADIFVVKL